LCLQLSLREVLAWPAAVVAWPAAVVAWPAAVLVDLGQPKQKLHQMKRWMKHFFSTFNL
jgi:hypothetical protein